MRRGEVLVFADELFVFLYGTVRRVWAPIGEEIRQCLDVGWSCERLSLAVEPIAGTLEWQWLEKPGQEGLQPVVDAWAEVGVRAVVWDGAPAHISGEMRRYANERGIRLIRQPPHSPELNPAERVIEAIRAAVEGRVFRTMASKHAAVEGILNELALDPEQVRQLTRWDWIHQAILRLPP